MGLAWPTNPGFGSAFNSLGFSKLKPEPSTWPGVGLGSVWAKAVAWMKMEAHLSTVLGFFTSNLVVVLGC